MDLLEKILKNKIESIDWDIIVTEKDGVTTTKKVLYKDDGTEIVNPLPDGVVVVDKNVEIANLLAEKAAIEARLAELQK